MPANGCWKQELSFKTKLPTFDNANAFGGTEPTFFV